MFGRQARPLNHPLSVSPICLYSARPRLSPYPPAPTLSIFSKRFGSCGRLGFLIVIQPPPGYQVAGGDGRRPAVGRRRAQKREGVETGDGSTDRYGGGGGGGGRRAAWRAGGRRSGARRVSGARGVDGARCGSHKADACERR